VNKGLKIAIWSHLVIAVSFLAVGLLRAETPQKETYESRLGKVTIGDVTGDTVQLPFITWGGDVATFVANGGLSTTKDSLYGKAGLSYKMVAGDDFNQQVRDYLSGKSPYLRGTVGMLCLASETLNRDPRTKPVMILQMTWSAGDHIVAREGVKTLNQLKGKKICLQSDGPHLTLLDDSLKAAGLSWSDVTIVWAKNLTGDDSPAELFKKDATIDACCVISPDMIGLCSGIDQIGSGAEGSVKGCRVVNSTASMSHSIADVYVVRSDYFSKNRDKVQAFVANYLKATEQLLGWKNAYNDGKGKSPEYMAALKMAQSIYTDKVLPTLENDAHGLVSDATFSRFPGNETFFDDPNNLIGFDAKTTSALELAVKMNFAKDKFGFVKAGWDFKGLTEQVGLAYQKPTYAMGRIKGEVADFAKDLDSNTIFSFEIKFEPEQVSFNVDTYAAEFQRLAQSQANFGNAVILIRGHSDPTLALQNFFWAAKAKGMITGEGGNYKFKGQPLDLTDTGSVSRAIQAENLAGQKRVNSEGVEVGVDDPKVTVAAALQLSQTRSAKVKDSLQEFFKQKGYKMDLSQVHPIGVGIAEPVNARPRNMQQAKENMRVEFRVVRVKAEKLNPDEFNFDK
jgi:hypothetical protein